MIKSGQRVQTSAADKEGAAREARILDAAANLITRYGYEKTTVSDIAREAGISKGAIYLHYSSKEALFESLLKREMRRYRREWLEAFEADPRGGTLGGLYKAILSSLDRNPFVAAMLSQDSRVFGNYVRRPGNVVRTRKHMSMRQEIIANLQEAGVIRRDVDPRIVAHIMNLLAYGLVAISQIMDANDIPPAKEVIEGISEIFDRALTPTDGGDSEAGKAIMRSMIEARAQRPGGAARDDTDNVE